ncbi:MAG: branched-chain amino acid ABC transporter permease [Acidobacteriota bacterium]|nr:branched-chain amino acid ABC transporter permease [Acidobacteriota bacterium]MDQ2979461.1 branched-chain amino acid ABC transporter permease [Acidobacteriota bacterium]
MKQLIAVLVNSLLAGGLYATMSYGLAVIYGVMRIINLAHAGILMLGAYTTFFLFTRFHLDPFLSLIVVLPLFFLFGVALYLLIVRRLPRSGATPSMESLLLLFGLWLVLQNLAYALWGGDTQSILTGYTMKSVELLGVRVGVPMLLVFGASAASLLVLNVFLRRTYIGKAIRAVTQNRDAALIAGVNADRISATAFGLGTAFAAMAGSLMATLYAFTPDFGRSFLLKAFCIIVLGGMESVTGVALGAFVLALLENVVGAYTPIPTTFQDAISFTLLVVVLVLLPQGLPRLFARFSRAGHARG